MEKPILRVFENVNELLVALADRIVSLANIAIDVNGEFTFVLSGGNSPKRLYELLASDAYASLIDWTKVYFFFGDERYVPVTDPESNAFMARKALFDPLEISDAHIFSVDTSLAPEQAAEAYFEAIRKHFKHKSIEFDCVLLGLGDNAHTASLFPYTAVLSDREAAVKAVFVAELDAYRITFTAPLINQADEIIFLVYGERKHVAVKRILGREWNIGKYPAQLIQPDHGSVYWYLDEAASP